MAKSINYSDILKSFFSIATNNDGVFKSPAQSAFLKAKCDSTGLFIGLQVVAHGKGESTTIEWHVFVDDGGIVKIIKNMMGYSSTFWERPSDVVSPVDTPYKNVRGKPPTFITVAEQRLLRDTKELWEARLHSTDNKNSGRTELYDKKIDQSTERWLELNSKKKKERSEQKRKAQRANKVCKANKPKGKQ